MASQDGVMVMVPQVRTNSAESTLHEGTAHQANEGAA